MPLARGQGWGLSNLSAVEAADRIDWFIQKKFELNRKSHFRGMSIDLR
jgi:hypothetical protein